MMLLVLFETEYASLESDESMIKTPWMSYRMEWKGGQGIIIYGVSTPSKIVRFAFDIPSYILLGSQ